MKQRYFIEIAYKGTTFAGWQIQPNAIAIQELIEKALSTIYNSKIGIVGCGRTDAGVHALQYYFHVDLDASRYEDSMILYKLNGMLSYDIAVKKVHKVDHTRHARFDASGRAYTYYIHFGKDPFRLDVSYKYNQSIKPDIEGLQKAAALLLEYDAFFPFCKTNTEVDNYKCEIMISKWIVDKDGSLEYHIKANRFLRGMVRLIVGMCINVAMGKVSIDTVKESLDNQERLESAWSVPSEGLFLSEVTYDFIKV